MNDKKPPPRKTFGVSPKKVRNDANTREAEEEIHSFEEVFRQSGRGSRDDLYHLPEPRPPSNILK
jgi:hypothetical protein